MIIIILLHYTKLHGKVNKMNISDVRVRKISDDGKMKAIVSITIDDEFVVHYIFIFFNCFNGICNKADRKKLTELIK